MDVDMKNAGAVFLKQAKDTMKNKTILIQFVMFPALAVIMENFMSIEGMTEHFFVKMFAAMYVGMAPLISMSAVLAEEKEKCTLKMLMMSDVKPAEYLLGTGSCVWSACMMGSCVMGVVGEYAGKEFFLFMLIMAVGTAASILIGAAIGTWSRNQMTAASIGVPFMLVFSFLPMLSIFNETIGRVAKITYSEQVSILINGLGRQDVRFENIAVLLLNIAVAFGCFAFAYKRSGLG
ncbi:MAG: ABC transporter permease [Lachnospiraceae bacterium]|nr:ABC transporter permease [Lachnospiraceae bacterium]